MSAQISERYDRFVAGCEDIPESVWSSSASLAAGSVSVDSDDPGLFDGFFTAFGGSVPQPGAAAAGSFFSASIRVGRPKDPYGRLRLSVRGAPHRIDSALFGAQLPGSPYVRRECGPWTTLSLADAGEELFAYRDETCLFRKPPDWTRILSILYREALRVRDDVIFFHASALSVSGRGILLVARKNGGKSTTALALAARGHLILADSCACYRPASGDLVPFRRPVGIREGPMSRAVSEALDRDDLRATRADDSLRVDLESLIPQSPAGPVPLDAIFFIQEFAPSTEILPLVGSREQLAHLQPMYSSFANAPHSRRAFELIRLLGHARLFSIHPGHPDEAATRIEEVTRSL
jgi:hypothetical protein